MKQSSVKKMLLGIRKCIKGAESYLFNFFPNFLGFWYHKKAHIFLITHVKFHSWKVMRLEDINKKISGYGNRNELYVVIIGNCNIQNCLPNPHGFTNLTSILKDLYGFQWKTAEAPK